MAKIVTRAKATVCGQPKDNCLALSFELSPEQEEMKNLRGRLFGVIEIIDESPDPNPLIGKKALEIIHQAYFQNGDSNLNLLKVALEDLSTLVGVTNGAFIVIWEDISYLATFGNGRVLIWRQNLLSPILEGTQGVQTASGKIISDDLLVLQTASFTKIIDDTKITTSFDHRPVAEIAEGLLPQVLENANSPGAAALFLQFNVEEKIDEEPGPIQIPIPIPIAPNRYKLFLTSLLAKIPKNRRDLYLRGSIFEQNKKNLKLISAGLVFAFLLFAIIGQIRLQKTKESTSEFGRVFFAAQNQLNSRQDLLSARQSLVDYAVKKYGQEWSKKKDAEIQKIKILISQINEAYLVSVKIYKVENPISFYDLSLLKDRAKSTQATIINSLVLFLDTTSGTVFSLDTKTKNGTIVTGDELFKNTTLISARADWLYLLGSDGIYRVDTIKNKKELLIKKDEKLQEIISQVSFAGNLYLLDKKANQIWKYVATETGFSDIRTYLNSDVKPNFSQSVSMDIDGSVYVLETTGKILKYTQGLPESFNLTGLDGSLNSPTQIVATDNYLYIHDKENRRVVLFNKKGEYYSQYQIGGNFDISQILPDEPSKKLFLISGPKIYIVDLK